MSEALRAVLEARSYLYGSLDKNIAMEMNFCPFMEVPVACPCCGVVWYGSGEDYGFNEVDECYVCRRENEP